MASILKQDPKGAVNAIKDMINPPAGGATGTGTAPAGGGLGGALKGILGR